MSCDTRTVPGPSLGVERANESRQRAAVFALLATVAVLDQGTKWFAWHQLSGARINSGGCWLAGPTIGQWYAGPVTGALTMGSGAVWVWANAAVAPTSHTKTSFWNMRPLLPIQSEFTRNSAASSALANVRASSES